MLPKNFKISLTCLHAWLPRLRAIYSPDAVDVMMSFSVWARQWNIVPFRYRVYALVLCRVSGWPARSISVRQVSVRGLPG